MASARMPADAKAIFANRAVRLLLLLTILASLLCLGVGDSSTETSVVLNVQGEYPAPSSMKYYGFDYVVEPFRKTALSIKHERTGDRAPLRWKITQEGGGQLPFTSLDEDFQSEVEVVFENAGREYQVEVWQQDEQEGGSFGSKMLLSTTVICKYVRREIRSLHQEDQERFHSALVSFYSLSSEDGKVRFGPNYRSARDLTILHLAEDITSEGTSCTPWHGGVQFIPSHLAFILQVEQTLQLFDPTVSIPYWDYVKDSEHYGLGMTQRSEVFTDSHFGAYKTERGRLLTGRWSGQEVTKIAASKNEGWVRHNVFGTATDYYNNAPNLLMERANRVCGLGYRYVATPNCLETRIAMEAPRFVEFADLVENGLHGKLHVMLGGAWDCAVSEGSLMDLLEEIKEDVAAQLALEVSFLALPRIWGNGYVSGYYQAPEESCWEAEGLCPYRWADYSHADIADMTHNEVMAVGKKYVFGTLRGYLDDISRFAGTDLSSIYDGHDNFLGFTNVTPEINEKLVKMIVMQSSTIGSLSQLASPLAATDDPLFAALHSFYHLHWSYMQLTKPNFDTTWDENSSECYGYGEYDVLPWKGFQGEDEEKYYTNRDLLEIFHPLNSELPYMHDAFDFVDLCGVE
mmetsp:Transcript_6703/g.10650  ORF Transcript_6703/g.10650 Transcript_6703/m.10650 type:complete len:630 (+) Transcript_6703:91-1980(+)